MANKFKINQLQLFSMSINDYTYKTNQIDKLFNLKVNMSNLNIYKGEKYPITINVLAESSDYSNFTIENCIVEIKNKNGYNIDVYGETSIDTVNNTVLFSWDTSKYAVNTYIIVIWVIILYNGTEFKICTGNISKTIRDIDIIESQL